jgi:hypothetical protein
VFHEEFLRDTLGVTDFQLERIKQAAIDGNFMPMISLTNPKERDAGEYEALRIFSNDLYKLWQRLLVCEKEAFEQLKQQQHDKIN